MIVSLLPMMPDIN